MAQLEWKAQFETGIELIDTQHKRIVSYINELDELHIVHPLRPDPSVGRVITELVDYTLSHFAFEESLMVEADYDFATAHKKVHEGFTQRIGEYRTRFQRGENIARELHDLLVAWLVNHILYDDAGYVPSIKAHLDKRAKAREGGWLSGMVRSFFGSKS